MRASPSDDDNGLAVTGRIPENVIGDIRDRTDIVQIIGQYVQLRRSGANFKGLCPFHEEKTPSFNVNAERQFYHCFGCSESGDVFTFLMKMEGRHFAEVVEDLAGRAGVEIPRRESPEEARSAARRRSERQRALDLNAKVARLYRRVLLDERKGAQGRAYLEQRGIGTEVAESFLLGLAPQGGQLLTRMLDRHGISLEFAEKLGLVARRRGGGYYDRFWNRLMFPLMGAGGEVLGFGGRRIGDGDGPKYVNTPETALYRKGEALYGLSVAAPALRRSGTALLVEGNFDVVQMHQAGFDTTVAPMGTALTDAQMRLLGRFAAKMVALFDGDEAGQAAARRAVPTLVAGGIEGRIATVPRGEDPDSILREHGAPALSQIIERAVPAIDFLIADLQQGMEDSIPARVRLLEQVAPVVARLESRVGRDLYIDRLALSLRIERATVERAVASGRIASETGRDRRPADGAKPRPEPDPVDLHEVEPLAILVEHPHLFARAEQANLSSLLTNEALRATYSAAMEMQRSSGTVQVAHLLQVTPSRVRDVVARILLSREHAADGDPTRALDDCISYLQRRRVERELRRVRSEIERAQSQGDATALGQLRQRLIELIEERRLIHETR